LRALKLTGALPQNVNYAIKSSVLWTLLESVPEAGPRIKSVEGSDRKFEEMVKQVEGSVAIVIGY